ncbi:LysM peptidoglycan-binding domain-containing protein [Sphingobium sp. BHU LFT2]|uniref:CIS tube protein n=1 Tax=Sphingobium sp. BHU LFT2 TaxID=2807634 RepID=UPI001BE6CB30|nr:LysM peptidoglycan-binding domain-containing protein [Sphingobium sp. BHU LFT2]MBT2245725.1 LysM peptidoglycan-binding domain-containing protein [Sphingobium sp. BHU LFT2]
MFGKSLEKAYIEVLAGVRQGTRIKVLFNPAEYSLERANAYKATALPGLGSPLIQFVNGDAATLSMDLFLDDWTDPNGPPSDIPLLGGADGAKSVKDRIDEIIALLDIDRTLHAPPPVRFVWGPLRFEAVIEKIGRKTSLFRPDGTPARASLSISFKEFRAAFDIRLESPDKTKRRQIDVSESIWTIADKEFGDPRRWRVIAAASDVDDPRSLRPGDWLRVPPLEVSNALNRTQ